MLDKSAGRHRENHPQISQNWMLDDGELNIINCSPMHTFCAEHFFVRNNITYKKYIFTSMVNCMHDTFAQILCQQSFFLTFGRGSFPETMLTEDIKATVAMSGMLFVADVQRSVKQKPLDLLVE